MRYYKIEVGGRTYTSHPNGPSAPPDPGALLVELDVFSMFQASAAVNSYVRIWGISIQEISQALDLNLKPIKVYGGMGKGLPLANPSQSGLLAQGTVIQAFGNWMGTDMTLDLVITAPQVSNLAELETPRNLVMNWRSGQPMKQALESSLKTAFPNVKLDINIRDDLKLDHDEIGPYPTLPTFSQWVKSVSKDIVGKDYYGVDIATLPDGTIRVTDGSTEAKAKPISFLDLVGQPTWVEIAKVQATVIMRADIQVGDYVTLPQTQIATTGSAVNALTPNSGIRRESIFKGNFRVIQVHHVGNSRTPDGRAWVTVLDMIALGAATSGGGADSASAAPIPAGGFGSRQVPYN